MCARHAWSTGGGERLHFRCAGDNVILGSPKEKLSGVAPSCPGCGTLMEKLPESPHAIVEVRVDEETSTGSRPEI